MADVPVCVNSRGTAEHVWHLPCFDLHLMHLMDPHLDTHTHIHPHTQTTFFHAFAEWVSIFYSCRAPCVSPLCSVALLDVIHPFKHTFSSETAVAHPALHVQYMTTKMKALKWGRILWCTHHRLLLKGFKFLTFVALPYFLQWWRVYCRDLGI